MHSNGSRRALGILWLVLSTPFALLAQQAGIVGTITDQTGGVVPGANISAKNVGTSEVHQVVSTEVGQYSILNLDVGVYQVTAEKRGFRRGIVDQVKLEVQLVRTVDVVLQVGDLAQEISVSASPTPVETTSSSVGALIENKLVQEIPLNGRNFLQLQWLLPGVTMGRAGTWTAIQIDGNRRSLGGGNFTANGVGDLYNDFLLDGVSFKEWEHGTAGLNPSLDAVQEFKTLTSTYSAEFGSNAGGLVNMVTKSGTNTFHGTVYEFLRNDKLDATNFFTNKAGGKKGPSRRNQFGGTLGGPIRRDKTFFFADYEGFRQRQSATLYANLPTASMRQGDFSELLALATPVTIHDPFTRVAYAGNVIPSDDILPEWPGFFQSYIPLPNRPGLVNNYIVSGRTSNNIDQFMARIDHQLSEKLSFSGRYLKNKILDKPYVTIPGFFITQDGKQQNLVLHLSYAKSSNTILDYRGGYNLFYQNAKGSNANTTPYITRDVFHIMGLSDDQRSSDGPCLSATSFTQIGCATASQPREWISEAYDHHGTIYLVRGRHNIRGGITMTRHHETFPETYIPNGMWSFNGSFSGYGVADMLLGMPSSMSASPDLFDPQFRFWMTMPWLQDDWRVTPNLTLNLGIRYERIGRPYSKHDDISNIRIPAGYHGEASIAVAAPCDGADRRCAAYIPVVVAATRSTTQPDNNNFAPRLGFAYRIRGSNRTVLRAGYGIFYHRDSMQQNISLAMNPPFVGYWSVYNTIDNIGQFDFYHPLGGSPIPGNLAFQRMPEDYRDPYLQAWNIGIQRELGGGVVLDLAYVGNKATKEAAPAYPNQPSPGPGSVASRRPFTNVGQISSNESRGNSNYHSMQLKAEKRYSQGFTFLSAYTWSKAICDAQPAGEWAVTQLQNTWDRKANRGLTSTDARHRFTLGYLYELPFGHGKRYGSGGGAVVSKVASGWQVGGLALFQSGMPLTAILTVDRPNVGEGAKLPNRIGDPNAGPKTVEQFFNTGAFQLPDQYTWGNAGIGTITSPGINSVDLSIIKNTQITERFSLQFRTEIFNLANHLIMADPNLSFGTLAFGQVTGTRLSPRQIQFALRLQF